MTDEKAPTEVSAVRRIVSVVWAILPLATLGFLTAPLMVYASYRLRHWLQFLLTALYTAAMVGWHAFDFGPQASPTQNSLYSACITINMLFATGHAFVVRRKVFRLDTASSALARQREAPREARESERSRTGAREVTCSNPRRALEPRIGRPDIPDRSFPDGGLVDVNNVPEATLRAELAVSNEVAHAIVERRSVTRGFESAEEVSVLLDLPPFVSSTAIAAHEESHPCRGWCMGPAGQCCGIPAAAPTGGRREVVSWGPRGFRATVGGEA